MNKIYVTPWAQEMLYEINSNVCKTFTLSGNIGDYAYSTYSLINYLKRLFCVDYNYSNMMVYDTVQHGRFIVKNGENCVDDQKVYFETLCNELSKPVEKSNSKDVYIIQYPQTVIPSAGMFSNLAGEAQQRCIMLHKALTSANYLTSNRVLIIITESLTEINQMFISSNVKVSNYQITLPNYDERLSFIKTMLNRAEDYEIDFNMSAEQFALTSAGLTFTNIEDIVLQGISGEIIDRKSVMEKKAEIIKNGYSDIIELLDSSDLTLDDFAGQENIKKYFKEVVVDAIANNNTSIVPKGVLLMGPPGTGKTYFSRCLAGSAGINFVEFKMSKILDKYVGEAEKKLERAFAVFRALSPVGVFIDEIDQALSRGENSDNMVSKNIFGMFLAELSKPDNRGKIIWLAATNYPNKLDEALKRTGRFDKKIPFFAPSAEERENLFKMRIKKSGCKWESDLDFKKIAQASLGYTQAEIEGIVVKANELSIRGGSNDVIRSKDMYQAMEYIIPAQNRKIKDMEDIALNECNDLELIPEQYRYRKKALSNIN